MDGLDRVREHTKCWCGVCQGDELRPRTSCDRHLDKWGPWNHPWRPSITDELSMLWDHPVPDTDDEIQSVSGSSDIDLEFQNMDVNSSDDNCNEGDEGDEGDSDIYSSSASDEEDQVHTHTHTHTHTQGREQHIEAFAKQLSELVTYNQIGTSTHTHTHTHTCTHTHR